MHRECRGTVSVRPALSEYWTPVRRCELLLDDRGNGGHGSAVPAHVGLRHERPRARVGIDRDERAGAREAKDLASPVRDAPDLREPGARPDGGRGER